MTLGRNVIVLNLLSIFHVIELGRLLYLPEIIRLKQTRKIFILVMCYKEPTFNLCLSLIGYLTISELRYVPPPPSASLASGHPVIFQVLKAANTKITDSLMRCFAMQKFLSTFQSSVMPPLSGRLLVVEDKSSSQIHPVSK